MQIAQLAITATLSIVVLAQLVLQTVKPARVHLFAHNVILITCSHRLTLVLNAKIHTAYNAILTLQYVRIAQLDIELNSMGMDQQDVNLATLNAYLVHQTENNVHNVLMVGMLMQD